MENKAQLQTQQNFLRNFEISPGNRVSVRVRASGFSVEMTWFSFSHSHSIKRLVISNPLVWFESMFFEAFSLSLSLSLCFAGSPSLWWGNDIIFVIEEEFARTHDNLDARLYMSVGELENAGMIEDMKRMEYILQERNYPDLKFKTKIFPDEIHQTCYPAALTRSLMFLYGED